METEFQTKFLTAGSLLYSVEHRPWLPPDAQWLLSHNWNDLLFAHFAIEKTTLRQLVPDALTLDIYDGMAWLTVSSFSTSHLRPSGIPPLPGLSFFPQLHLRTYVTMEDRQGKNKPGVYYFSADATNLSAVWLSRIFFRMQYWHATIKVSGATIQRRNQQNSAIHFHSSRLHGPAALNGPVKFEATYTPTGEPNRARRGSLEEFLTERYCVYTWNRRHFYRTELHHQPWPLQQVNAEIQVNTLAEPFGLALPAKPDLSHFSRSLKMLTWAPERVRSR